MWTNEEIAELEAGTGVCEVCGERDVTEALVSVDVATAEWHRCERLVHVECRDLFIKDNLPAVLASIRGVTL